MNIHSFLMNKMKKAAISATKQLLYIKRNDP